MTIDPDALILALVCTFVVSPLVCAAWFDFVKHLEG